MFVLSSSLRIPDPISTSRAPAPFLLLGDPGLLTDLLGIDSLMSKSRLRGWGALAADHAVTETGSECGSLCTEARAFSTHEPS